MMSRLLTCALIMVIYGCENKEYRKEENSNVSVVSELNQGESEVVIEKLSSKSELTSRERYYLASAYSQKGGVDVFSLYSLLEMQLFRKNALEWSDLSKEKNPYLKFMKSQEGVDFEKRLKKREERWNTYLPKILEKHDIDVNKPGLKVTQFGSEYETTQENYDLTDTVFKKEYDKIMELPSDLELRLDRYYEFIDEEMTKAGHQYFWPLSNYYGDLIHLETIKQNYLHPEGKVDGKFANVPWEMVYMNILWNTYEAIPLMKQLPALSSEQQEHISSALESYKILLTDAKFKEVALKNIIVLSAVSLLSVYKEGFDLEEINSIQDLMCSFEPKNITNNYGLIRKRLIFLAENMNRVEKVDDLERYRSEINSFKDSMPESLSEEQVDRYHYGIEKFKLDSCFNG